MKWYIDEDGFPKASLVKKEEGKLLLKNAEDHNRLKFSVDDDLDDVYDESLLPNPTVIIESSLRSELKHESAMDDYTTKMMEAIKISDTKAVNFPSLAPTHISGPPTVPPQLFDMQPRSQRIVITEPTEEEDYLEQSSPDSVLFKTPEAVMHELSQHHASSDEIMAEQYAIEADLLAQKLKDAADNHAQASNSVPESLKMGNNQNP
ncbi:hypothetical protein LINGRAHAP2_LOCUS22798 [Linum grandiflorum]